MGILDIDAVRWGIGAFIFIVITTLGLPIGWRALSVLLAVLCLIGCIYTLAFPSSRYRRRMRESWGESGSSKIDEKLDDYAKKRWGKETIVIVKGTNNIPKNWQDFTPSDEEGYSRKKKNKQAKKISKKINRRASK